MRLFSLTVWSLIVALFYIVLLASPAAAQTNTPTPTRTATPTRTPTPSPTPHITATPVGIPTGGWSDGQFRYCFADKAGSQAWDNAACGVLPMIRYDPQLPDGSDGFTYISEEMEFNNLVNSFLTNHVMAMSFIPPPNVVSFEVSCSYSLSRNHVSITTIIDPEAGNLGGAVTMTGYWTAGTGIPSDALGGGLSLTPLKFTAGLVSSHAHNWVFSPYLDPAVSFVSWPKITMELVTGVLPSPPSYPVAAGSLVCAIHNILSEPVVAGTPVAGTPVGIGTPGGWSPPSMTVVASTPTPGPTATGTPTVIPTRVPFSWEPSPFVPVPNVPASFGLTAPGEPVCITILEAMSYDGIMSSLGYEVVFGWEYLEICVTPYGLQLEMFGWDIGLLLLHVCQAGGFFAIARRIWGA